MKATCLELKTVVDRKRLINAHCKVGKEEEDRTIMEEPSDRLDEKQKHGRRYGRI